ncbi:2-aminoethanethiol dioxygenase [Culicoides brevitarsis]|uniref:2-aminoethanethiol dioxygenase n=1 Tax=Culicoides brevitarsis TaxID=469753 RepID=UPI00307C07FD
MTSMLSRIIRQARQTFEPKNLATYQKNFLQLRELVNGLQNFLDPELMSAKTFAAEGKAPCTFVNIYESETFTLTVFILRNGYTMPLHDHPDITGLLKVINGRVKIRSYTKIDDQVDPMNVQMGQRFEVSKGESKILSPDSPAACLTPSDSNFHEIQAIEGNAAFFDVLSPPYDEDIGGNRKCSFYRRVVERTGDTEKLYLEKIRAPYSYYCDVEPFELPETDKRDIL